MYRSITFTTAASRTSFLNRAFALGFRVPQLPANQQNAASINQLRPFASNPTIAADQATMTLADVGSVSHTPISERPMITLPLRF
jgi:hypothetical protein